MNLSVESSSANNSLHSSCAWCKGCGSWLHCSSLTQIVIDNHDQPVFVENTDQSQDFNQFAMYGDTNCPLLVVPKS